ncbi:MAG: TROVE domain-containing protein, partial [Elusimicrobiales bacterium]|nr:TROVE domain-containing protein [Elusimicrobiales bacterium]
LITMLLSCFIENQYYRSKDETIKELVELINKISDKKFIAKTALYARNEFGMRSVSHIVAAELAYCMRGLGNDWKVKFFEKIIHRVDDALEIFAYYLTKYGKKGIPNALKRGIAKALANFNEYHLAKYKNENKNVSLIDLVNLCHIKPQEKNKEAFYKLMHKQLKNTETWESILSEVGKKAKTEEELNNLKSEAWKYLILNKKLGYMALIKNLRNIIKYIKDENILDEVVNQIKDEKSIKESLILPFRFYNAIEALKNYPGTQKIITAISDALDLSLSNVPKFPGKTLVALDQSGSMKGKVAILSSLLAAILSKVNDADLIRFSDYAEYMNYPKNIPTVSLMESLLDNFLDCGTNFENIFLLIKDRPYDRIILISDMQPWDGNDSGSVRNVYNSYKKLSNSDPFIYSYDITGYGNISFSQNNDKIFVLSGFNPNIFDVMKLLEINKEALLNAIEQIDI